MKNFLFIVATFLLSISSAMANENILSNYIDNGIKYFSKEHPKSFDLNVEIKYPSDWQAQEGLRPHVVQKFVSEKGKGLEICLLLIQELPTSLSKDECIELSKDVNGIKEGLKELNAKNIKIIPTFYSGIPGNLIEFIAKVEQAGIHTYMNAIHHTLYFKNKSIALQCMVGDTTENKAIQRMAKTYNLFRSMGNDIILHNLYTDTEKIETIQRTATNDKNKIDSSYLLISILINFIFTWGLGLMVPLIIRFGFKKKLSKSSAFFVVSVIWLFQFIVAEILSNGQGNHRHTALLLVAMVGYSLIVEKETERNKKITDNEKNKT